MTSQNIAHIFCCHSAQMICYVAHQFQCFSFSCPSQTHWWHLACDLPQAHRRSLSREWRILSMLLEYRCFIRFRSCLFFCTTFRRFTISRSIARRMVSTLQFNPKVNCLISPCFKKEYRGWWYRSTFVVVSAFSGSTWSLPSFSESSTSFEERRPILMRVLPPCAFPSWEKHLPRAAAVGCSNRCCSRLVCVRVCFQR